MHANDKAEFVKTLNLCYATLLKPLPPVEALGLWWAVLEPYSIDQVKLALSQHMRESKFPPVPVDVVSRMPRESDGRPDANEAWAIALTSRDERDTVCWTQECAQAFAIATPVLEGGDEVGARMAFKAAYERLVDAARAEKRPAQWQLSLGHDPVLREAAATDAVRAGRLLPSAVAAVVPALAAPQVAEDPRKAAESLARLRAMVAGMPSAAERLARARAKASEIERAALADAKRLTAQRVAAYEASHA